MNSTDYVCVHPFGRLFVRFTFRRDSIFPINESSKVFRLFSLNETRHQHCCCCCVCAFQYCIVAYFIINSHDITFQGTQWVFPLKILLKKSQSPIITFNCFHFVLWNIACDSNVRKDDSHFTFPFAGLNRNKKWKKKVRVRQISLFVLNNNYFNKLDNLHNIFLKLCVSEIFSRVKYVHWKRDPLSWCIEFSKAIENENFSPIFVKRYVRAHNFLKARL